MFHALFQNLNEVFISHIKKFVEYDLREHWEELGMPKDFSLVPDNNLSEIVKSFPESELLLLKFLENTNQEFSAYRKSAFTDRKAWLTPEAQANLPNEYDNLRLQYKDIIKECKIEHEAFFRINRRATFDDWKKHWQEFCDEKFPDLSLTNEVENYTASQLAYRNLANIFGFSPDYMEKIIRNAKRKLQSKSIQDTKADISK